MDYPDNDPDRMDDPDEPDTERRSGMMIPGSQVTDLLAVDPEVITQNNAATRLQTIVRRVLAVRAVQARFAAIYLKVYDPKFKEYFWYNRITRETQWNRPLANLTEEFLQSDIEKTRLIQRIVRSFLGKMRARRLAHSRFSRYYEPASDRFYWIDNSSQVTTWKVSSWMVRQNIPMPIEDNLLHKSYLKIKELEEALKSKDSEIKDIRKLRYDELEPQVILDRVKNAKDLVRSKQMDEWTMDQLSAWFEELKLGEHVPYIYANRMDGLLFINLTEMDWAEMKITSKIHIRKLQIIMKTFRIRYQRKRDKVNAGNDDEDDLSEYSPSEISEMIDAEDK
jgi:hypothetical protein